jgi:hypothetical protein
MVVSFIDEGNSNTKRKPLASMFEKSLTKVKLSFPYLQQVFIFFFNRSRTNHHNTSE